MYYEDELYHWGVKGMKWGVRRYQDRNGRLTPLGKQHLADNNIRTEENLVEKTIPKGTKMYRATPFEKDNDSRSKYVTYLDVDRNMYKDGNIINGYTNKSTFNNDVYEHEFRLKSDIHIPSLETVRKIEKNIVSNDKARREVGKAWIESFMMTDEGYSVKDISVISKLADRLDKTSTDKQRNSIYKDLVNKYDEDYALFCFDGARSISDGMKWVDANDSLTIERSLGRATNVKNDVIKELKKLGYNAMYDNASIGVGSDGKYSKLQEGVEPLIIFDSDEVLQKTSTRKIDKTERQQARTQYTQWLNEKNKLLKNFK